MITEAKRAGGSVLWRHVALALALGVAVMGGGAGCVASAADIEAQGDTREDSAGDRGVNDESATEEIGAGLAEQAVTGAAAQPSAPDPAGTPQPSPWKPNGPGLISTSPDSEQNTPDPAGTPQPSPWEGHNPNGPNTAPTNILSTQQN